MNRRTALLSFAAGIVAIGVSLACSRGAVYRTAERHLEICLLCLQRTDIQKNTWFGVTTTDRRLRDAAESEEKNFKAITGAPCAHPFVNTSGSIAIYRLFAPGEVGDTFGPDAISSRIRAIETTYKEFAAAGDRSAAREAMALVNRAVPADFDYTLARLSPQAAQAVQERLDQGAAALEIFAGKANGPAAPLPFNARTATLAAALNAMAPIPPEAVLTKAE